MEFKRQLAERSFEPGVSVALFAHQDEVNANLLFRLRSPSLIATFHSICHSALWPAQTKSPA
jgi:transposase-like protein